MEIAYLLVNFGGPRSLPEIEPFLISLFTDKDVIRTKMPSFLHNYLFRKIAKKRVQKVEREYLFMGGGSPIYADTEAVKEKLSRKMDVSVLTYHRYLPMTHKESFAALEQSSAKRIIVFPLFPQFSYATTGSVARQMKRELSPETESKFCWVKSYGSHPAFISLFVSRIKRFLIEKKLVEEEIVLLFSAHGLPLQFITEGDPYQRECEDSFQAIAAHFPRAHSLLSYQSKVGRGEWLHPYTCDVATEIVTMAAGRKKVLFVPLSFTSDHLETLVEIQEQYMPLIAKAGLEPYRLDAFNQEEDWIITIQTILTSFTYVTTSMLVRSSS